MQQPKKNNSKPFHLIDTNVVLRFLIGDDPPKAERAHSLMIRVERNEEKIEISEGVLIETVWTLESFYKVPRMEIAQKLSALLIFRGVQVRSRRLFHQALQTFASSRADFVDCLLACRAKIKSIPVYTFDETDFKTFDIPWESP